MLAPSVVTVADTDLDIAVTEVFEPFPGVESEFLDELDAVDLIHQLREDRGLIADAGADLQRHVARLQLEQIGHQRYDEGLRDGLAVADRQRRVEIGIGLQLQRHEFVAGDLAHRLDHLGSERGLAELSRQEYRIGHDLGNHLLAHQIMLSVLHRTMLHAIGWVEPRFDLWTDSEDGGC